jgi:hypothetical protein
LPLLGAGGVFLVIVGAAIILGALRFRSRYLILALGAAAASIAIAFLAVPMSAPYGAPSPVQLWSLALAVAFEIAALRLFIPRAARRGERALTAALLAIVSAHFLIMTPAFGPIIFALGIAGLLNAIVGAQTEGYALPIVWGVDGGLKAVAGVAMVLVR